MVRLNGTDMTRAALAARAGGLGAVGGVRLMELSDGLERGIRMLEFRTGSGLRFTVLVDRAMDIAEVEHKGRSIGWHSPSGFRHPGLHEYEGEDGFSWARSFSGFLVTCGLDHILGPETVAADHYKYPGRKTATHSLHGRISTIPARLTGYGETWTGDQCVLWAEGVVQQATVFGENLHLHRRIEADLGGNEIRVSDRVVNAGFRTTPHMFFYHVNLGYPLLDQGTRFVAPIADTVWAAHAGPNYRAQGVGYAEAPAPIEDFIEQVWQFDLAANATDEVSAALINDDKGLGLELVTRKSQLPCFYHWQNFQAGEYAVGLEPSTHHVLGNNAARDRHEMIWLNARESRSYDTRFRVLDGHDDIAETEKRVRAAGDQPSDGYPEPSGQFKPLPWATQAHSKQTNHI